MKANYLLSLLLIPLIVACQAAKPEPPQISFVDSAEGFATAADFDRIEQLHPLTAEDRQKITPENIAVLPQAHVDQIYARISAGRIPDGSFAGNLFFPEDSSGRRQIAETLSGLQGVVAKLPSEHLESMGRLLWKGKTFYRDQEILRNQIEDTALLAPLIDGRLSDIPKIEVEKEDTWLLFPAKVYCGESRLDPRRESIVIDYAFSDEIEGYRHRPDHLAGRDGLKIRDEIRLIRPGFYLGRAYADDIFLLNFTLYRDDVAAQTSGQLARTESTYDSCSLDAVSSNDPNRPSDS